jgi:co-chaperonin GroES (HSP10)
VVTEISANSVCKIGDTVIFPYIMEEMCGQMGRIIEDETGKYFIIDESTVVVILRDGVLLPTDGWIIARRAEKAKEKTDGGIIIPEAHRKESDTKFVVVNVHKGYEDCAVGDVIYTEKDCDIRVESNEIFGILPDDLFKIETRFIVAIAG